MSPEPFDAVPPHPADSKRCPFGHLEATEEAITNALVVAARTLTGANGFTVTALPHDRMREVLKKYNRLR